MEIRMKYQTIEQLSEMHLTAMKTEYQRQMELADMQSLLFDDRFAMIVNAMYTDRNQKKLKRMLKAANLRDNSASLDHIDYSPERNFTKNDIMQLTDMDWIRAGISLLIIGATGVGKTYISSALGREACRQGFLVRCYRTTLMLTDLEIARSDGSYEKKLAELARPDLLILDDFGMKEFDHALCLDFGEVVEERHRAGKVMMISSQMPVRFWPKAFQNPTSADGFMDRVTKNAYRLMLKGPSRRPQVAYDPKWDDSDLVAEIEKNEKAAVPKEESHE